VSTWRPISRPVIKGCCRRCGVTPMQARFGYVVVSPSGKAHHGEDYGNTACGKDATGENWWWPL
jgi:hypothetical protein